MKILVGLSADQGGQEALALGAVLARSCNASLVACTVTPDTWGHPSPARVDGEYGSFLARHTATLQAEAKASLPADVTAEFLAVSASSAREGLIRAASETGADCLVLGSAREAPLGRFGEGGVTTELLRSAHLPIMVAPHGYSAGPETRVRRLSAAYSGSSSAPDIVARSAALAHDYSVPLRLVTFVVRDKQMYPTGAGYDAEQFVSNVLREQARDAQTALLAGQVGLSAEIADGASWKAAFESLDWQDGEVLVLGSSKLGPILRVFLGSNARKIVHNAPVPCLILPRGEE
ncbi:MULTISPECIES: universal stress protein [unclassified Shinella]|uniref:universal stress protein n=1 Tax=unclassified Shinella TaxID=2643062 RepID=UPI00234E5619|nr:MULTISPECIES: universal stress protein [unclassified Shinella]MCO5153551.1 universal stress protein [Shinella sp.]MDC7265776.1 universal stress protein [Shinella sp. HY16]MDC7272673.1 universal stress protein [Shinella sp. YZ44]